MLHDLTYALIIFAILLILIFFGVPIAWHSIELSVVVLLVITHLKPLILIPQKLERMDTFVYLAIPLFTLAGHLMEQEGYQTAL